VTDDDDDDDDEVDDEVVVCIYSPFLKSDGGMKIIGLHCLQWSILLICHLSLLTLEMTAIEPHKYRKIKVFSDTSFVFQCQHGKQ
jgi:hypothetical protein